MNRFPTITSPLLKVATCVLGVLALAMALLLTGTGRADQQPASQPHASRATLTSYQQGAAGTHIAEGGTATRIAAPQGWQCWHVFHYERVWFRVPATNLGTLFFAADVCNDGQHAFLKPNGDTPGCWTNDGWTGTATLRGCGATPNAYGSLTLHGNMTTTAIITIPNVPVPLNLETNDHLEDLILPNTMYDPGPTGGTDAPGLWTYLSIDGA